VSTVILRRVLLLAVVLAMNVLAGSLLCLIWVTKPVGLLFTVVNSSVTFLYICGAVAASRFAIKEKW
jgi:uncharacterized membrane protein